MRHHVHTLVTLSYLLGVHHERSDREHGAHNQSAVRCCVAALSACNKFTWLVGFIEALAVFLNSSNTLSLKSVALLEALDSPVLIQVVFLF